MNRIIQTLLCAVALRRTQLIGLVAVGISVYIGFVMVYRVSRLHPFADAGWPLAFDDLHRLGMAVVILLIAGILPGHRAARASTR